MGILSNMFGDATEVDSLELDKNFSPVLFEGEQIEAAFQIFRDKWIFTNHRLIILNVQGVSGKKKEYHSIPYKSITQFSVETDGTFDTDSEIKIWIAGQDKPIEREFKKSIDVVALQQQLAFYTCKY